MAELHGRRREDSEVGRNVGTMWTMRRNGSTGRCALVSASDEWELRLLIDGELLLSTRSTAIDDLLPTAEEWRVRLIDRGWTRVTPSSRCLQAAKGPTSFKHCPPTPRDCA